MDHVRHVRQGPFNLPPLSHEIGYTSLPVCSLRQSSALCEPSSAGSLQFCGGVVIMYLVPSTTQSDPILPSRRHRHALSLSIQAFFWPQKMSRTQTSPRTDENDQKMTSLSSAVASSLPLTLARPLDTIFPSTALIEGTPSPTASVPRLPPLVFPIATSAIPRPNTSRSSGRLQRSSSTKTLTRPTASGPVLTTTTRRGQTTVLQSITATQPSSSRLERASVTSSSSAPPSTSVADEVTAPTRATSVVSASTSTKTTDTTTAIPSSTTTFTANTSIPVLFDTTTTEPSGQSTAPKPTLSSTRTFVLGSVDNASPTSTQPSRTGKAIPGRRTPIYRQSNSSSLDGRSSPSGAKFEQLTDDGDVTCEVQDPNSVLSFVSVMLVIFGLGVCAHFFWRTLKEWKVFWDQQRRRETDPPKSPLPAPISLSPSTQRQGSIFKSPDSNSDSDVDSDADTVVDDSGLPPEIQAKHAKLRASLHSMPSLHRRPSTRSNSSSSSTSSTTSRILNVPTLLLIAWSLYLVDQLLYATVLALLYWVCPEYNCWSRTPLLAPNCPTMPELFTAYVTIQPVASGVFVTAVMLMFMRIFSVLSPRRRQVLQLGSMVIVLVTLARLITMAASQYVRRAPETWPPGSPTEVHVWMWYTRMALAGSLLNAVLVKLALIMGLGYISGVRADVCALRQSVLSLTVPPGASIMISPAGSGGAAASRHLSTRSSCLSRSCSSAAGVYASLLATAAKCESIERRAVRARRWIVTGIIVITGVVVVHVHQKFGHGMPVQVCNAIFASIQVAFAACVSMAMAGIMELISCE